MTLPAERRQQGARMVTQRMQLEEDFVLQLLQEREGRRQAEASLQGPSKNSPSYGATSTAGAV